MTDHEQDEPTMSSEAAAAANKRIALEKLKSVKQTALNGVRAQVVEFLRSNFHRDPEAPEAQGIEQKFMAACVDKNMGERFALSLTDEFKDIQIVKLASTEHDVPNESQRLYSDYNDLRHWFEKIGIYEMPRTECDSAFSYRILGDPKDGPAGYRAVVTRVRPLIFGQIDAERAVDIHEPVDVLVYKETVFSVPAAILRDLLMYEHNGVGMAEETSNPTEGEIKFRAAQRFLETLLYGDGGGDEKEESEFGGLELQRIHTAYYSYSVPAGDEPTWHVSH